MATTSLHKSKPNLCSLCCRRSTHFSTGIVPLTLFSPRLQNLGPSSCTLTAMYRWFLLDVHSSNVSVNLLHRCFLCLISDITNHRTFLLCDITLLLTVLWLFGTFKKLAVSNTRLRSGEVPTTLSDKPSHATKRAMVASRLLSFLDNMNFLSTQHRRCDP